MQKLIFSTILMLIFSVSANSQDANLNYSIDLNDCANDTFKVTLNIKKLSKKNNIYQFAATAPGTYQTMNIGRFVSNFKAFDKKGKEVLVRKEGPNQYQLSKAKKIKKITYEVAETWDTNVEEYPVYAMCGTSIENDHVLLNPHCVIGYPNGMQNSPLTIELLRPKQWKLGTALSANSKGAFYAKSFDHAVDSPILLGRLSKASTNLNGTKVDIFTYSKTDLIKSDQLMASMSDMLNSAAAFVVDFPVDRYTFLFHFEDTRAGAWEHSYSSEYVIPEQEYSGEFGIGVKDMAAHEFFHIITPLNIHSEVIERFNFISPTPSEHLWLYEGTTEWASHMMQLRYGSTDFNHYFNVLSRKLSIDERFDTDYSLSQLSMNCFTKEGQQQYANIYMRGALVAGLLDIKLLELSDGKRGLREVINELSKKYGPNKAFPEDNFFDVFTQFTYPEIADFFNAYVKSANPLPIKEYYDKLGINYTESLKTGEVTIDLGADLSVTDGKLRLTNIGKALNEMGVEEDDELIKFNGVDISLQNARQELGKFRQMEIGEAYTITVNRNGEEIKLECKTLSEEQTLNHVFTINEFASQKQIYLRAQWLKNL